MDLNCLADCGPSHVTVALLLLGALLAMVAARRARWTVILTVPLLYAALAVFAGGGFATPAWWLTATVLGLPLLGLIPWPRVATEQSKRSA